MSPWPNPLVPGFNPDPSVVLVDGVYHLVTSSFEYLPGIPVYRSTDMVEWTLVGNVATRPEQVAVEDAPTGGGVWAPTIRYRDGVYYVIVTIAMSPKGCVVFTATDPAGPWSDGTTIDGIGGIDPDLAWDDGGNAYVTFSGLVTFGEDLGKHLGIQQVRVDLEAGKAVEAPRSLWSGTGLKFPEAPHVYQRDGYWYLMIAEGGTERGHSVSIARGPSIEGPFEGHPANPILSAKGTGRPIQNTGHADLVDTPDGGSALVMLGMRPLGATQSFSPLGRETFITELTWGAEGWPTAEPLLLAPRDGVDEEDFDLGDPAVLDDPGWLSVRATPGDVATVKGDQLLLEGDGSTLSSPRPRFLGRRQRHLTSTFTATLDVSGGVGGLAMRYDESHHVSLEARAEETAVVVTARASLAGVEQTWTTKLPAGDAHLSLDTRPPGTGFSADALGGDRITLSASTTGEATVLATLDGRYWTAETAASFTGRVVGAYVVEGTVAVTSFRYQGSEQP
jgi:beta-xylosidase